MFEIPDARPSRMYHENATITSERLSAERTTIRSATCGRRRIRVRKYVNGNAIDDADDTGEEADPDREQGAFEEDRLEEALPVRELERRCVERPRDPVVEARRHHDPERDQEEHHEHPHREREDAEGPAGRLLPRRSRRHDHAGLGSGRAPPPRRPVGRAPSREASPPRSRARPTPQSTKHSKSSPRSRTNTTVPGRALRSGIASATSWAASGRTETVTSPATSALAGDVERATGDRDRAVPGCLALEQVRAADEAGDERRPRPRGRPPAAGRPARSVPACITTTRSDIVIASRWSCVTMIVVIPSCCWRSRSSTCSCSRRFASSADSGSSSRNSRGSSASARAVATRWRCPPDSCWIRRSPSPSSETSARSSWTLVRDPVLLGPPDPQPVADVAGDVQVREQREALEDHPDVAGVGRPVGDVVVVEEDPALGRMLESGDHPEHRGLAAPGRPEERDQLARAGARGRRPPPR